MDERWLPWISACNGEDGGGQRKERGIKEPVMRLYNTALRWWGVGSSAPAAGVAQFHQPHPRSHIPYPPEKPWIYHGAAEFKCGTPEMMEGTAHMRQLT